MSLSEKLAGLSKNLQETKKQEEEVALNNELAPVRKNISDLEAQKYQLELIKGSLGLKSNRNEGTGIGMKEYAGETKIKSKNETEQLDKMINENKEALKSVGVGNIDDLVSNQEFSEEKEVIDYKEAKNQEEGLNISDASLKEKLQSLGLNVDENNFSYENAEKLLSEKLELLEGEITKEKIKTPEGKEEVIETIIKNIENDLPKTSFLRDEKTKEFKFVISSNRYDNGVIDMSQGKTKFTGWNNKEILPKDLALLEEKYGKELVAAAIKKSYETKVDKSIKNFDANDGKYFKFKEDLQAVSPIEGQKAYNALKEYKDLQNEFRRVIKEKSDELKEKGIDFSATSPMGYGGSYEEFISLDGNTRTGDTNEMIRDLDNTNVFPPKYDYVKLQAALNKQKENLQEFVSAVSNIQTKEDVEFFTKGNDKNRNNSLVSKFHMAIYSDRISPYDFESSFTQNDSGYNNRGEKSNALSKLKSEAKTYNQAERIINEKTKAFDDLKEKILSKIDLAVDAQLKKGELEGELSKQNFSKDLGTLRQEILSFEKEKKWAQDLMIEITRIEASLPQGEVILRGADIIIVSAEKESEKFKEDAALERENYSKLEQKIRDKESDKPKLWGKDKWETELNNLRKEKEDSGKKIVELDKSYNNSYSKKYVRIPVEGYSYGERILKSQKESRGDSSEIFNRIKNELNETINKKVPEDIDHLYKEYTDLEKQLA